MLVRVPKGTPAETLPPPRGPGLVRPAHGSQPSVRLLRGSAAILNARPRLAALARDSGQTGETDSLAAFLAAPDLVRKTPYLLFIDGLHGSGSARASAAVLLFEYKTSLAGTRVFTTSDGSGRRDVIAPPEFRARAAAFAARTLLARGAHLVLLSFSEVHRDCDLLRDPATGAGTLAEAANAGSALSAVTAQMESAGLPPAPAAHWALREGRHPAFLPLLPTLEATLARIGQKTRANLRYYRRRCELELGCTFVPRPVLTLAEFLAFNRECTYAVEDSLAAVRYRMLVTQPNQCVRGIRDAAGRWLALVGTRRQNGFVEIDWQMNRAAMPARSLATVLRSFLIEHEIALGSTRLYIEGGTPQPIGRSFLQQRVSDLIVKRDSAYIALLERFAGSIFPPRNYIGCQLQNPQLRWHPCPANHPTAISPVVR